MRAGNIKKYFFVFFLIFTQFVFAEDKIELVPLINLEELTPTFEEGKDELEKIEDQSSITNKIDTSSNELKSLKSDNTVSNHFAEFGGLLLLVSLPIWVVLMGTDISAIDAAKDHGNEVGATIIASSFGLQMVGILLVVGLFSLGISLTLLRKYKGIIGILFIIVSVATFIDMAVAPDSEIIGTIGWMGMFLMTLVTGILTTIQKEN